MKNEKVVHIASFDSIIRRFLFLIADHCNKQTTSSHYHSRVLPNMKPSNKNFQVYVTGAFAAIGGLLFGYDTGVISGVLTMSDFLLAFGGMASLRRGSLTSSVAGSIVGIMLVGCFIGALLGGPAGDRLSRKYSIVVFSIVFIISAALQTGAVNLFMLLLSRLIAGVSVGALSMLVPVYQSEIATKEIRGRLVSLQQWAITIGIAVSFWINYGRRN